MAPRTMYPDKTTPTICIIGAGIAGLCAAIQLKRQLGISSFTIFEKAQDVGGCWLINSYPGCQVEVPGLAYCYSFEQNPGWSQFYPDREEVLAYLQKIARKYELYSHVKFNSSVTSMRWNEESNTWCVATISGGDVNNEQLHEFQIIISGTGPLREPNYPLQFQSFTGPMMHSATWDSAIELKDKVVGVVGTGSSAIQIIPSIAPLAKKLIVYMRAPNYVIPKPQFRFPRIMKLVFTVFPILLWVFHGILFLINDLGTFWYSENVINKGFSRLCLTHISWRIKNVDLRKLLTPRHQFGYKIPALSLKSYYETFNRSNVSLEPIPISRMEGQTIFTEDGKANHLDVLILCTGFNVQDFFAPIQINGANGIDLMALWKARRPEVYYGVTCNEAPNLFFLLGPNSGSGHGSAIFTIECQVNFTINALRELMKRNAASVRVSKHAQDLWMVGITDSMKNKIYLRSVGDGGWIKNDQGFPTVLWPHSNTRYWWEMRRLPTSNFEFEVKGNQTC